MCDDGGTARPVDDSAGGGRAVKRCTYKFTPVTDIGTDNGTTTNQDDSHVYRMRVTFILAAISTGNAALTTEPTVNRRVWRSADQLITRAAF